MVGGTNQPGRSRRLAACEHASPRSSRAAASWRSSASSLITGCGIDLRGSGREPVAELLVHRVEDDDPARRRAALPGVREGRRRPPSGRRCRDLRRRRRRARSCRRARGRPSRAACAAVSFNPAARLRRAGEADEIDARVLDERGTGLPAESLHHVQHAGGQTRLGEQTLAEVAGRRGNMLGRLEARRRCRRARPGTPSRRCSATAC